MKHTGSFINLKETHKSIIKWKNKPIERSVLEKAKKIQEESYSSYIEKKNEFFNSNLFQGWSAKTRYNLIMSELKSFLPKKFKRCIEEAGGFKND